MTKLNDSNYADYIATGNKIVVCTAGYCKPCIAALRDITAEYGLLVLTDPEAHGAMIKTRCNKVPTVIYYRDGKELKRAVGTAAILDIQDQACMSLKGTDGY